MDDFLKKLNIFLGKAALATYAGSGEKVDPETSGFVSRFPGFKELEYKEGPFYYRDSYSGFFASFGQEVVFYENKPVWTQLYGGGMQSEYRADKEFAHQTFDFLKKALSHGEKIDSFQPRGEKNFKDNEWEYSCDWSGDITKFKGDEEIFYKNKLVFTHHFFGGLIEWV